MDENLKNIFQHLEYMGCTNEYDEETKWAEVNHPIRDFQIFCGGERTLFHRTAFSIKEKLSTKKSDEIIRFMPLTKEDLKKIIKLQLTELTELISEQDLDLQVDEATVETLALEAYEPEYGARTLRRILRRRIENPLATKLLEDQFIGAKTIRVKTSSDNLKTLEFTAEN